MLKLPKTLSDGLIDWLFKGSVITYRRIVFFDHFIDFDDVCTLSKERPTVQNLLEQHGLCWQDEFLSSCFPQKIVYFWM